MTTVAKRKIESAAELFDLIEQLGGIPPSRVLLRPTPGEATEEDLLEQMSRSGRICELIDGVLVEKAMGRGESGIAGQIIMYLAGYILPRDLGFVTTEGGMARFREGVVLAPDISFFRRDRAPNGQIDMTPIGTLIPDLAVEVISADNTKAEIERKIVSAPDHQQTRLLLAHPGLPLWIGVDIKNTKTTNGHGARLSV